VHPSLPSLHASCLRQVALLQRCDGPLVSLVSEYSCWALARAPEAALAIFTARPTPLPHDLVLRHLESVDAQVRAASSGSGAPAGPNQAGLVILYLEHVLSAPSGDLAAQRPLHDLLAQRYVEAILPLARADKQHQRVAAAPDTRRPEPGTEIGLLGRLRPRLLAHLRTSVYYLPEPLIAALAGSTLYDELAILYERAARYPELLALLVRDMHEPDLARAFCAARPDPAQRSALLLELLRVVAALPPPQCEEQVALLLRLHEAHMDPAAVVESLPPETPLAHIHIYLERAVRRQLHRQHEAAILNNLLKARHVQVTAELAELQQRFKAVDAHTPCDRCHKNLGDKVCLTVAM